MDQTYLLVFLLGLLMIAVTLFSDFIEERSFVTIPIVALFAGVVAGQFGLHLVDTSRWPERDRLFELITRIALVVNLVNLALRLPPKYIAQRRSSLAVMLGILMPLMGIVGGVLIFLFTGIPLWLALLLGAIISPTDPILSSAFVDGRLAKEHIPEDMRHLILAESGANDGLAYPMVLLALLILTQWGTPGLFFHWISKPVAYEVVLSAVIGAAMGLMAWHAFNAADQRHDIERSYRIDFPPALALLTLGLVRIMKADAILAAFTAGLGFNWMMQKKSLEQEDTQNMLNHLVNIPVIFLLGIVLPLDQWVKFGWRGPAMCAAVLLLRRLPAVLLLRMWISPLHRFRDALIAGWFGPFGISALFYVCLAGERSGVQEVWILGTMLISSSILVYGISTKPFLKVYARGNAR